MDTPVDLDALLADAPWADKAECRVRLTWDGLDELRAEAVGDGIVTLLTWSPVGGGRGLFPMLAAGDEGLQVRSMLGAWSLLRSADPRRTLARLLASSVEPAVRIARAISGEDGDGDSPEQVDDSPLVGLPHELEVVSGWEPLSLATLADLVGSPGPGLGPLATPRVMDPVEPVVASCPACAGELLIPAAHFPLVRSELCDGHRRAAGVEQAEARADDADAWDGLSWVLDQLDRPHLTWPDVASFIEVVEAAWCPLDDLPDHDLDRAVEAVVAFCGVVDPDTRHNQLFDWVLALQFGDEGDPCDAFVDTLANLHYRVLAANRPDLADTVAEAAAVHADGRDAGWLAESAVWHATNGDPTEARNRIEAARADDGDDLFVRICVGEVHEGLGELAEAEAVFTELAAEGRRGNDAVGEREALHHLVGLYERSGDRTDDLRTTQRRLAKLVDQARRQGRPTAPTAAAPAGRNDPCPCGSGRKYKHCCGAA